MTYRRGNLRLQAGAPHADHQRIPYKMTRGDSRSGWPDFDAGTADEVPGEPGVLVMHAAMKILHMGGPGNLREDLAGRLADPCTRDASRFKYMLAPNYRDVRDGLPGGYRGRHDGCLLKCVERQRRPRCVEDCWHG